MKRYACILLALLLRHVPQELLANRPQEKQYAVILSMDAFRWDLAGRSHTPTPDLLARVGTYAEIYPVYPRTPSSHAMAGPAWPPRGRIPASTTARRTPARFRLAGRPHAGFWGGEPI